MLYPISLKVNIFSLFLKPQIEEEMFFVTWEVLQWWAGLETWLWFKLPHNLMCDCGRVISALWTSVYLSHLNVGSGHRFSRGCLWIPSLRVRCEKMYVASAPLFQPEHLHSTVFYIKLPCNVSWELHCFKNIEKYWNLFIAKVSLPPPRGVSGSWESSISFLNVTGNVLRRGEVPRISHLTGQELGVGFGYSHL